MLYSINCLLLAKSNAVWMAFLYIYMEAIYIISSWMQFFFKYSWHHDLLFCLHGLDTRNTFLSFFCVHLYLYYTDQSTERQERLVWTRFKPTTSMFTCTLIILLQLRQYIDAFPHLGTLPHMGNFKQWVLYIQQMTKSCWFHPSTVCLYSHFCIHCNTVSVYSVHANILNVMPQTTGTLGCPMKCMHVKINQDKC